MSNTILALEEEEDGKPKASTVTPVRGEKPAEGIADNNIQPAAADTSVSQKEIDYALEHNVTGLPPAILEKAVEAAKLQKAANPNFIEVAEADHNHVQKPTGLPDTLENLIGRLT